MQELKTSSQTLNFVPNIRSGSFADIGPRRYMEDEHIRIDDLSGHLGSLLVCPAPNAFYGVCRTFYYYFSSYYDSSVLSELIVLLVSRFLMAMGVQMQQPT
jgi:hypothetical protein